MVPNFVTFVSYPDSYIQLVILIAQLVILRRVGRHQRPVKVRPGWSKRLKISRFKGKTKRSKAPSKVRYTVDSLFLADAFKYCTSMGRDEVFVYIAGIPLGPDHFVLTHLIPVAMSAQSVGGATADGVSSIFYLDQLDKWGLILVGHMHSHPGNGVGGTCPSSVDDKFVTDLAAGGYRTLGAIFSRDSYVRFYAHRGFDFKVEVVGHQIEEVERNVYRLDPNLADCDLPIDAVGHGQRGRGRRSGSSRASARI